MPLVRCQTVTDTREIIEIKFDLHHKLHNKQKTVLKFGLLIFNKNFLSLAGKRTARFLLAGACVSYVGCVHCVSYVSYVACVACVALDAKTLLRGSLPVSSISIGYDTIVCRHRFYPFVLAVASHTAASMAFGVYFPCVSCVKNVRKCTNGKNGVCCVCCVGWKPAFIFIHIIYTLCLCSLLFYILWLYFVVVFSEIGCYKY